MAIYFEDLQVATTTELVAYDGTRFLADFGGLIGLFVGMSWLSVFEVMFCLALYTADKFCVMLLKFA